MRMVAAYGFNADFCTGGIGHHPDACQSDANKHFKYYRYGAWYIRVPEPRWMDFTVGGNRF